MHSWQTLQWRHNERHGVSNHQPRDCYLNLRRRSKKTSKLRVTGLCEGNSPVTDEFPAQRVSNAENASFDDVIMSWSRWGDSHQDRKSSTLAARKLVIFHRSFRHLNSRIPYEQSYCVRLIDNTGVSTTIRPDTQLLFATTVYVLAWSSKLIGTSQEICLYGLRLSVLRKRSNPVWYG